MFVSYKIWIETDIMFEQTIFFCTLGYKNANFVFSEITAQELNISQKHIHVKTSSLCSIHMLELYLRITRTQCLS